MRRAGRFASLVVLALALAALGRASSTIDLVAPERVELDQSFTLEVVVTSSGILGLPDPKLTFGDAFQVVGTASSSKLRIVEGVSQVEQRTSYILRPRREGRFEIGPASALDGERTLTSEVAVVLVGDQPAAVAPPDESVDEPIARGGRADGGGDVLVVAALDRSSVYVGEQARLSIKLLTLTQAKAVRVVTPSDLAGFWVEEIKLPEELPRSREDRGGRRYTAYTLRELVLFPTTAGEHSIGSAAYEVDIVTGDFLFQSRRTLERRTLPLKLVVKPLPEAGKPPGFGGAVGEYALTAAVDHRQGGADEAFVVKVTASGRGNPRTLPEPTLPDLPQFKHYTSTSAAEIVDRAGSFGGKKTWEYVFLPRAPGDHTIPAFELAWFDPAAGAYRLGRTEPVAVTVAHATQAAAATTGPAELPKTEVRALARDINYIKLAPARSGLDGGWLRSRGLVVCLVFGPLLLNVGALAIVGGRARRARDPIGRRRRSAARAARKRLTEARAALRAGSAAGFAERVGGALTGYVADRFNEPVSGLTRARIEELLDKAGCEPTVTASMRRELDRCDYLRFTPAGANAKNLEGLLRVAEGLVKTLEGRLGGAVR